MEEILKGDYSPARKRILFLEFLQDKTDLEKFELFKLFYKNLPIQGSSEWLLSRRIGGSSAAAILGQNKYSTPYKTACEILGKTPNISTVPTKFGNTFEEVAKIFLSRYIDIAEFGSLWGFGEPMCTTYSPDGLFMMNDTMAEICGGQQYIGRPILLEIKCLYNRKIGAIPEYYLPQLYLGMETISITPASMFSEFVIRPCSIYDFGFNSRHKNIGYGSYKDKPHAIGCILYKINKPEGDTRVNLGYNEIISGFNKTENTIFELGRLYRYLEGRDLLDIEIYRIFFDIFPDYYYEACEFLHIYLPRFEGIDYGTSKNFIYRDGNYEDMILSTAERVYSGLLYAGGERECKHFLREFIEKYPDYYGIMPYKILDYKLTMVEKKDYSLEVKKLIFFGKGIFNKEGEELKEFCDKFNRSFNNTNN